MVLVRIFIFFHPIFAARDLRFHYRDIIFVSPLKNSCHPKSPTYIFPLPTLQRCHCYARY